jgi:hypothetical protein
MNLFVYEHAHGLDYGRAIDEKNLALICAGISDKDPSPIDLHKLYDLFIAGKFPDMDNQMEFITSLETFHQWIIEAVQPVTIHEFMEQRL